MSCVGRFGITAVLRNDSVNQQLHAFLIPSRLPPKFYAYVLRSQVDYMEQLSTATTIAYLNKENCNSLCQSLPPLAEQERISLELDRQMSFINELEVRLRDEFKKVHRLRQSILTDAFIGKLVPQDPNDEPASALLERIRDARASPANGKPNKRNKKEPAYAEGKDHAAGLSK